MSIKENTQLIAQETFKALGGQGRLTAMIGAKNFTYDSNDGSVAFRIKSSQNINYIKVSVNSMDLYDIEFGKIFKNNYTVKNSEQDIYNTELKHTIEQNIKQYLTL